MLDLDGSRLQNGSGSFDEVLDAVCDQVRGEVAYGAFGRFVLFPLPRHQMQIIPRRPPDFF